MMNNRHIVWLAAILLVATAFGATRQRDVRNGGSTGIRRSSGRESKVTNVVHAASGFSKFKHKAWVTGTGRVKRILDDDDIPPCHQRFILEDDAGDTILVAHNIDEWERLENLEIGDTVAFKGEYISNPNGAVLHWTHPDNSRRKPGGWLKKLKGGKAAVANEIVSLPFDAERKEYFAGRGPMETRTPAPVNSDWPETGYWLSTNSGARHNRRCENYRKTRGYPCKKNEGRPCGKCGG